MPRLCITQGRYTYMGNHIILKHMIPCSKQTSQPRDIHAFNKLSKQNKHHVGPSIQIQRLHELWRLLRCRGASPEEARGYVVLITPPHLYQPPLSTR